MKKLVSVSIKTIIFFVGWAICVSVIPIPNTASVVIWRFWAELIPLVSIIALTLIFWLIDKRKTRLHLTEKLVNNIILGCVTGAVWLGVSVGILAIIGVVHIDGRNQISMLWLWMISAFLNTVMQEMLVRGYLYQMLKSNYNIGIAVIVSTGLFTFAHGGAFEAGILPVLNVITMSLEQNRCAMACQGCDAVFLFLNKKQWKPSPNSIIVKSPQPTIKQDRHYHCL